MNVLLITGSPHLQGCTYTALSEVAGQLEKNGIGSNIVHIGSKPIRGCIACGACRETGLCVFDDDPVNECSGLLKAAEPMPTSPLPPWSAAAVAGPARLLIA